MLICVSAACFGTAKIAVTRVIRPGLGDSLAWRRAMNWDQIEGKWKQFQGKAQEKWGKLTDDDFDKIAGKRDQLVGKVQESYGIAKDAAEREVDDWARMH
jgi:uncharacterized protein YjbJ (UPF0337 family)